MMVCTQKDQCSCGYPVTVICPVTAEFPKLEQSDTRSAIVTVFRTNRELKFRMLRRASSRYFIVGLLALLVVIAVIAVANRPTGLTNHSSPVVSTTSATPSVVSVVAHALRPTVPVYATPSSKVPFVTLHNPNADGGPLVFLVAELPQQSNWVRVYLPIRPNGSEGWIHGSSVQLAQDAYSVIANEATHRLTVLKNDKTILTAPVGVGRSVLPTPTGIYYLAELLQQPNPNGPYGPYAFGLSAFSNVLQSFGGGPGQIGLHGTDVPNSVGSNVSHGCLRVSNAVITKLAHLLPLGTPIRIVL
jgi:lipoprotein-anchoring transpeptidase ErfK/SrfK